MITEEDLLNVIATICETIPKDQLNNDVAHGVAYAVGYLGGRGEDK